jgi:hypothetical protein
MIKRILFAILICISLLAPCISADSIISDVIQVRVPPNIYIYNDTSMVITLIDIADGSPVLNVANNISCYVRDPDGGMLANGTHPAELSNGIYQYNFSIVDKIGTYVVWAEVLYQGYNYLNAALFEARYDPYTNITSAVLRMGETISLINWETRNSTQQIVSHVGEISNPNEKAKANANQFELFSILRQSAEQALMQYVFMTLFVVGIFIVSTFIYGRRRGQKIAKKAATLPTTIVGAFG